MLAHSSIGLAELVRFIPYLFIEGEEGFVQEEDCSLIHMVDTGEELGEVEVLNCHCI